MRTFSYLLVLCYFSTRLFAQLPPPPATQDEVDAGTIKNKYVSPATLAGWTGGGGPGSVGNIEQVLVEGANADGQSVTNLYRIQATNAVTGVWFRFDGTNIVVSNAVTGAFSSVAPGMITNAVSGQQFWLGISGGQAGAFRGSDNFVSYETANGNVNVKSAFANSDVVIDANRNILLNDNVRGTAIRMTNYFLLMSNTPASQLSAPLTYGEGRFWNSNGLALYWVQARTASPLEWATTNQLYPIVSGTSPLYAGGSQAFIEMDGSDPIGIIKSSTDTDALKVDGTTLTIGNGMTDTYYKENGKNGIRIGNNTRQLFAADGSTVSIDYTTAGSPQFNGVTFDIGSFNNGELLGMVGGAVEGVSQVDNLTVETLTVTESVVWPIGELGPSSAVTNFIPDFTSTNVQTIMATGNVYIADFVNLSPGLSKLVYITNVFRGSSNITAYVQTNLMWFGNTNGYITIGATPMHTNRSYPITNGLMLSLMCIGTTDPSIAAYAVHQSP